MGSKGGAGSYSVLAQELKTVTGVRGKPGEFREALSEKLGRCLDISPWLDSVVGRKTCTHSAGKAQSLPPASGTVSARLASTLLDTGHWQAAPQRFLQA